MASRIFESTILDAPIETVWELLRPLTFSYNPQVLSAVPEAKSHLNEVGGTRIVTYKDKTVQHVRLTELSDARHTVAWEIVQSNPPGHVLGASYKVAARRVTKDNLTFVEWAVDFSRDVTAEVLADAKFKAQENFKALGATAKAKTLAAAADQKVGKAQIPLPQLKRQLSAKSQLLHNLFQAADKNRNGQLEFDEFAVVINKLYGENLADEAVKALLREADANADGVVSYDEFTKFLAAEGLEAKAQLEEKRIEELTKAGFKLTYFDGRGRGEIPRLLFVEAGVPFVDHRIEGKDWPALKASTPFGQLPILEFGNVKIAQSFSIARYIAKVTGLYGNSLEEMASIDQITEAVRDIATPLTAAFTTKDEAEKKAKFDAFFNEILPQHVANLEKILVAGKGPYFVGKRVSLADISFFGLFENILGANKNALNSCPNLLNLFTRVKSRPQISAYLAKRKVTPF